MSDHKDRGHRRFGGSTAHRWVNCPASVLLCETLPPQEPSEAADRGTLVHEVGEKTTDNFLHYKTHGQLKYEQAELAKIYDKEALALANNYTLTIWEKVLESCLTGKAWGIEEPVVLDEKLDIGGIIDFWCIYKDDHARRCLAIMDYKNGHYYVEEKKNLQFILYAASFIAEIRAQGKDIDFVRTCVYQPNAEGESYREATYTIKQIETYTKKYFKAALDVATGKAKFKVGDWCFFCEAKKQGKCKKYAESISVNKALQVLQPETIKFPPIESIPDETKAKLVLMSSAIKDFLSDIYKDSINKAKKGINLPGVKMVENPGKRGWREDLDVGAALRLRGVQEPHQPAKLISLGDAEKLLGKGRIDDLTEKGASSFSLVSDEDSRLEAANALTILKEIK